MGAFGTVFQVIHEAAKFMQTAHGTRRQLGAQTVLKQSFKQTQFVLAGQGAQSCQSLMTNAALRAGHGPQESRVVVVVHPTSETTHTNP